MWGLLHGLLLVLERPFVGAAGSRSTLRLLRAVAQMTVCLCLRHHALDFLQAAELRSCGRLSVTGMFTPSTNPNPTKAVLQSGAALFAAGHDSAPWFPLAVRANDCAGRSRISTARWPR